MNELNVKPMLGIIPAPVMSLQLVWLCFVLAPFTFFWLGDPFSAERKNNSLAGFSLDAIAYSVKRLFHSKFESNFWPLVVFVLISIGSFTIFWGSVVLPYAFLSMRALSIALLSLSLSLFDFWSLRAFMGLPTSARAAISRMSIFGIFIPAEIRNRLWLSGSYTKFTRASLCFHVYN